MRTRPTLNFQNFQPVKMITTKGVMTATFQYSYIHISAEALHRTNDPPYFDILYSQPDNAILFVPRNESTEQSYKVSKNGSVTVSVLRRLTRDRHLIGVKVPLEETEEGLLAWLPSTSDEEIHE